MSDAIWAWNGHSLYWSTSSPAFTGLVFRGVWHWTSQLVETQPGHPVRIWTKVWDEEAPGMQAPQQVARYQVGIAGPAWPDRGCPGWVERYVLRGSILEVRRKLADAISRRQRALDAWRLRDAGRDALDSAADG